MPIIVDPKKLSMPEQVQQNKEDIKNIYKIIDGLDSLDNVVEVPNMSHILTAQELKAIEQPIAFIIYSNKVYLKRKIESGIAYFDRVFSISGSTVITFDSEEIQATLSNGALALVSTSAYTYSKSEIDSKFSTILYVDTQLALKADLSGANFTGAITSPSIIENMSGYSFVNDGNMTIIYAGVVKNGNKITFVVFGSYTKTAGDSFKGIGNFTNIPSSVGEKLYPFTQGDLTNCLASSKITMSDISSRTSKTDVILEIAKVSNTNISLRLLALSALTDNSAYLFRVEQTFLLSDNLAQ